MPTDEQKQAKQAEHEADSMTTTESRQRGQEATTEQIVRELRRSGPLGPTVNGLMLAAARRLEQQELELVETLRERHQTVANLIDQRDAACDEIKKLKAQNEQLSDIARKAAWRAEPSLLELAGQIFSNSKELTPRQSLNAAKSIIADSKR